MCLTVSLQSGQFSVGSWLEGHLFPSPEGTSRKKTHSSPDPLSSISATVLKLLQGQRGIRELRRVLSVTTQPYRKPSSLDVDPLCVFPFGQPTLSVTLSSLIFKHKTHDNNRTHRTQDNLTLCFSP